MRETGSTTRPDKTNCDIYLTGTEDEVNAIRAMIAGVHWTVGVPNDDTGETDIKIHPRLKKLPSPIDDPKLPPNWVTRVPSLSEATPDEICKAIDAHEDTRKFRTAIHDQEYMDHSWHYPSIAIQGLGAGHYRSRADEYRRSAKLLMSVGFECLRSRRNDAGRYWEVWWLPYLDAALGDLALAMADWPDDPTDWRQRARALIDWAIKNVAFGSIDVCVQRAALTCDD